MCSFSVPVIGGSSARTVFSLAGWLMSFFPNGCFTCSSHPVHPFKLALIKLVPLTPSSCYHCSESFGQKRVWLAGFLYRIISMPIKTINFIWNTAKMRHSIMLWGGVCRYTHSELTSLSSPLLFDLLACCYASFFLCAFQHSAIPHRGTFSPKPH